MLSGRGGEGSLAGAAPPVVPMTTFTSLL